MSRSLAGALRLGFLLACAISASLLLSACGGGGDEKASPSGGGDEAQVKAIAVKLVAGKDASVCDSVTQEFLEKVSGKTGSAAKKDCQDSSGQNPPKDYSIDSVHVSGSTATVEATVDGDTGQLGFVQEDGTWKISNFKDLPG